MILSLLDRYFPTDPEEIENKKKFIDFVEEYPNCFDRSLEIGHLTASAWILSPDHSQFLLMHHAKLDIWCQLGGHCDGNENLLEVAIKEAQEESGISDIAPLSTEIYDLDIHLIPTLPAHYHYDVRFLLHVTSDGQIIQNHESKALGWFTKQTLPTQSRSILRMAQKLEDKRINVYRRSCLPGS